jgi:DNA-binding NarL/FixJ family response regulator
LAVLGVAHDHRRTVELAGHYRPAVLRDAHLPAASPTETPDRGQGRLADDRVLLLAVALRSSKVAPAIGVGAAGMVAKGGSSRQLADAIRRVVDKRVRVVAAKPPRPAHHPSVE